MKNIKRCSICHPHNPTGEILAQDFLKEALDFCKEKDIHLITDEIYALSVFDGSDHYQRP